MQLGTSRTDTIELTDGRGSESLDRFIFSAGEIVLADKGYGHRDPLARVAAAGAYFVIPLPYASLPLETPEGRPFDLFAALHRLPEAGPGEFSVQFRPSRGAPVACRLVAMRKSEAAAAEARRRVRANSKRHGATINVRTLAPLVLPKLLVPATQRLRHFTDPPRKRRSQRADAYDLARVS